MPYKDYIYVRDCMGPGKRKYEYYRAYKDGKYIPDGNVPPVRWFENTRIRRRSLYPKYRGKYEFEIQTPEEQLPGVEFIPDDRKFYKD